MAIDEAKIKEFEALSFEEGMMRLEEIVMVKYCAYAVFAFPVPNTFCFSNSSLFVIFI